jgi:hypothetical protein
MREIGNHRTWRSHISQIAQDCNEFSTEAAHLLKPKMERKPGRPPTQLVPVLHPLDLFNQFLENPTSIVCKYCRFNNSVDENEHPTS